MAADTSASQGSESSGGASFDSAFEAAFEEHGGDAPDEAQEEPNDTSESDEAGSADATAEQTETEAGQPTETSKADEFPEERDPKVKALYAKLPPEVRKDLNRVFTQRSQKVAAHEKFIQAFESDPISAARDVLRQHGVEDQAKVDEVVAKAEEEDITQSLSADLTKIGFTPEQSNALTPVLINLINKSIEPLREAQESITLTQVAERVDSELESFKKDFPDFEEIEPEMNKLMDVITPTAKTTTRQYLTMLRTIALGDKQVADRVKKTLNKMATTASTAPARTRPAASSAVRPGAPGRLPTFEEAAEAALRGETWGKGVTR